MPLFTVLWRRLTLRRGTVIGALFIMALLFLVYQLVFVAELSQAEHKSKSKHVISQQPPKKGENVLEKVAEKELIKNKEKKAEKKFIENKENMIENKLVDNKEDIVEKKLKENKKLAIKLSSAKPSSLKEEFTCATSGQVISADKVNDDYCDCPEDGSDEPLTNACVDVKFKCKQSVNGFPVHIPSSWVNDGICDCCDGSDEWQKKIIDTILTPELQKKIHKFLSPCPNQC
ncbi:uncharacterized protein LOC143034449 [Oratosquilla oratoria]|uniref:uncharacterized protein LOC143034449 n=1 Tax=Oratosquilla oratoria TaxID=337810 RepID=UPI003F757F34